METNNASAEVIPHPSNQTTYISVIDTAKLIRAELKATFPRAKFSVKSHSYSGGASINVSWTDGPTAKDVSAAISKFEGASFDASIDLKSYHVGVLNGQPAHFGADYIFTRRNHSVEFLSAIAEQVCGEYGIEVLEIIPQASGNAYPSGNAMLPTYAQTPHRQYVSDAILQAAHAASEHFVAVAL